MMTMMTMKTTKTVMTMMTMKTMTTMKTMMLKFEIGRVCVQYEVIDLWYHTQSPHSLCGVQCQKVQCSPWRKTVSISVNVGLRLCPSLTSWSDSVFDFDAPVLNTRQIIAFSID